MAQCSYGISPGASLRESQINDGMVIKSLEWYPIARRSGSKLGEYLIHGDIGVSEALGLFPLRLPFGCYRMNCTYMSCAII